MDYSRIPDQFSHWSPLRNSNHTNTNSDTNFINYFTPMEYKTQPDPDAITMYVENLPVSMDKQQLTEMFEEFGKVYRVCILRDKNTGSIYGCCIVSFYTREAALNAQNALHNKKTLDGMSKSIQMKPSYKDINDRKLYVSSLSLTYTEQDVRELFSWYGTIDDCKLLLTPLGISKRSALVTFTTQRAAINAIKALHFSRTLEGCSSPIVVKFASQHRQQEFEQTMQHAIATSLATPDTETFSLPQQQQHPSFIAAETETTSQNVVLSKLLELLNLTANGCGRTLEQICSPNLTEAPEVRPNSTQHNLLISNLPPELTDFDLALTFSCFGNVVYAQVFKGNGFVSYDSADSVQAAVQKMDGFEIGTNRLEVKMECSTIASEVS